MTCRNDSHYECGVCGWAKTCEERRSMLVRSLVESVIDWLKVDESVGMDGWNANNEWEWDDAKQKMESFAYQLKELGV